MAEQTPPWEPPLAGTEIEHVLGALDRMRATFRWKADGLDRPALNVRIGSSALTLGGLLKHLALCEDQMFGRKLHGLGLGEPWDSVDWNASPDWEFTSACDDSPSELYAMWDSAVVRARARVDEALAVGGLDFPAHFSWNGTHPSLRRLVCDMVEEYGRHTGHADLLREAIDGRVGEDPPSDWRPAPPTGLRK